MKNVLPFSPTGTGDYIAAAKISSTQTALIIATDKLNPAITATAATELVSTAPPAAAKPSCDDFRSVNIFRMMQMLDPVPDLISGNNYTTDAEAIAFASHGGGPGQTRCGTGANLDPSRTRR